MSSRHLFHRAPTPPKPPRFPRLLRQYLPRNRQARLLPKHLFQLQSCLLLPTSQHWDRLQHSRTCLLQHERGRRLSSTRHFSFSVQARTSEAPTVSCFLSSYYSNSSRRPTHPPSPHPSSNLFHSCPATSLKESGTMMLQALLNSAPWGFKEADALAISTGASTQQPTRRHGLSVHHLHQPPQVQ